MKNITRVTVLSIILWSLPLWLYGCKAFTQPGETGAESDRRHIRNARIDNQELMSDIDRTLLTDKPSKLSDKRIP